MARRIHWVDVAKCFGMFAIYLGHYGMSAGNAHTFVFTYHVPLFFFLAGCMEAHGTDRGLANRIRKVFTGMLIPWFVFCILSVVLYALEQNSALLDLWGWIWRIAKGTLRNTFFAVGLWFLTCLAVVRVAFGVLKKLRFKPLILLVSVVLHVLVFKTTDLEAPAIPFNAECAGYYLLYYTIGYLSFAGIDRILNPRKTGERIVFILSFAVSVGYGAYLFFGRNLLAGLAALPYGDLLLPVLTALMGIWLNLCLAKLLEQVELFRELGKNSLYLCGGEYFIRTILACICSMLGLSMAVPNPLAAVMWAALTLYLANRYLVPAEKKLVTAVTQLPRLLKKETVL